MEAYMYVGDGLGDITSRISIRKLHRESHGKIASCLSIDYDLYAYTPWRNSIKTTLSSRGIEKM